LALFAELFAELFPAYRCVTDPSHARSITNRIHPHFKKVGKALNGKAERAEAAHKAAEKAEKKRQNSVGKEEQARQAFVRDSEGVQRWATAIMFVLWAGGVLVIWLVASSRFLLQGDAIPGPLDR